jgi:hypothetical protein
MARLLAVLVIVPLGLAACSENRRTAPVASEPTTVITPAPGAVAPSTRDTFQGVGRPL